MTFKTQVAFTLQAGRTKPLTQDDLDLIEMTVDLTAQFLAAAVGERLYEENKIQPKTFDQQKFVN